MKLSKDQEALLRKDIAEGKTLAQIQEALQQAGAQMTYMELRFLLDDLGLTVAEKPEPKKQAAAIDTPVGAAAMPDEDNPTDTGGVQVTMDSVVRPGTIVSGSATFTDRVTVQWQLDQMGRLGLIGAPKGYQPPASDLPEFQQKLREMLESRAGM